MSQKFNIRNATKSLSTQSGRAEKRTLQPKDKEPEEKKSENNTEKKKTGPRQGPSSVNPKKNGPWSVNQTPGQSESTPKDQKSEQFEELKKSVFGCTDVNMQAILADQEISKINEAEFCLEQAEAILKEKEEKLNVLKKVEDGKDIITSFKNVEKKVCKEKSDSIKIVEECLKDVNTYIENRKNCENSCDLTPYSEWEKKHSAINGYINVLKEVQKLCDEYRPKSNGAHDSE